MSLTLMDSGSGSSAMGGTPVTFFSVGDFFMEGERYFHKITKFEYICSPLRGQKLFTGHAESQKQNTDQQPQGLIRL